MPVVSEFVAHALAHVRVAISDPDVDAAALTRARLAEAELEKLAADSRDLSDVELATELLAAAPSGGAARRYRTLLAAIANENVDLLDALLMWVNDNRLFTEDDS